jgi:hypothetical protein
MRYYYGLYATVDGSRRFAIVLTLKEARSYIPKYPNLEIRRARRATFTGGMQYGIDSPTFRVQSDRIYPEGE